MKKKTILTLFLALAMIGLTACATPNEEEQSGTPSNTATETATETATDSDSDSTTDSENNSATDGDSSSNSNSSDEKQIYYTVTFDTDGAGDIAPIQVLAGETVTEPQTPSKTTENCEYTFLGWFIDEEQWDFENDVVTENITLVAHWKEGNKYSDPFLPKD